MAKGKSEIIAVRVEKKTKDSLTKLAQIQRRELSDYVRLILEDIVNGKIIVPPLHENI